MVDSESGTATATGTVAALSFATSAGRTLVATGSGCRGRVPKVLAAPLECIFTNAGFSPTLWKRCGVFLQLWTVAVSFASEFVSEVSL